MNTESTADAVVRRLESSIPVYCVSDHGYSTLVSLVDGREFFVDAPFEGDVVIAPAVRTVEGALEDLEAGFDARRTRLMDLRVRDDVGGWAR